MANNLKQWWQTILPKSTQWTTVSHLKLLNTNKTTTFADKNGGPGLGQTQTLAGLN
jgi:hypothetical protein